MSWERASLKRELGMRMEVRGAMLELATHGAVCVSWGRKMVARGSMRNLEAHGAEFMSWGR